MSRPLPASIASGRGPADRLRGALQARGYGAVVTLTDLLPPRVRYGYVHRLTRVVVGRPVATIAGPGRPVATAALDATTPGEPDLTCALLADRLDVGGVGAVVETLAAGLGSQGVRAVVVCAGDGPRAERLRDRGVEVRSASDAAAAAAALRATRPDVIQLHSAPAYLEQAAIASGLPLVPVLHNTEIHFTRARWAAIAELLAHSVVGVAVSETVRQFHRLRLPERLGDRLLVIGNGTAPSSRATPAARREARSALEDVLGVPLGDDLVFVCLARHDSQKNIAGTVASFLRVVAIMPRLRLVVAGDPSDFAELLRADGLRRSSRDGDRVHLLGNSDPGTLLAASDAFVLNSFFEGWPVAATEAAAAGLPLLLSDGGGARELVALDPRRSALIPNACGPASEVSDARVRAARRRARHQPNAADLVVAASAVAAAAAGGVRRRERGIPTEAAGQGAMVAAHARLLRSVTTPGDAEVTIG